MSLPSFRFIACLAILAGSACAPCTASTWKIQRDKDAITDEISYFVYTDGSAIKVMDFVSYKPNLVVKVTPQKTDKDGGLLFSGEIMLQIETDGLQRGECEIVTRYDKHKPITANWSTSTDRHAAFSPDLHKTLARLKVSTNLTVRYMTTLGNVRTTTFDVLGLNDALKKVKSMHLYPKRK